MRVLYLPLDERPCNRDFPAQMAAACADVQLLTPPRPLLGDKKTPADTEKLAAWLCENFPACDCAILSLDMLVFGGIVPARLHHDTAEACTARLALLARLHEAHPHVRILAFSLIMRAPAYSSDEEEPDYYAEYGQQLCRIGVLRDKRACGAADDAAQAALAALEQEVPPDILADFTGRRAVNRHVNEEALALLEKDVLDFLVIPLDDCAEYGWAPAERRRLHASLVKSGLSARAYMYSGADEVGCILLARAVNAMRGRTPAVYVQYSSVLAPCVTPKYEDRPLGENLKWQIAAAGGYTVPTPELADFILMVNAPTAGGESMAEAGLAPENLDPSYTSGRCLPEFVGALRAYAKLRPVALADLSTANGADPELMRMLSEEGLLAQLTSYAAWNTAANAAGTCIAHAMLCFDDPPRGARFTAHRILEDWAYLADVRQRAWVRAVGAGCDYFHLKDQEQALADYARDELQQYAGRLCLPAAVRVARVRFPWHRLFEIELTLE